MKRFVTYEGEDTLSYVPKVISTFFNIYTRRDREKNFFEYGIPKGSCKMIMDRNDRYVVESSCCSI